MGSEMCIRDSSNIINISSSTVVPVSGTYQPTSRIARYLETIENEESIFTEKQAEVYTSSSHIVVASQQPTINADQKAQGTTSTYVSAMT